MAPGGGFLAELLKALQTTTLNLNPSNGVGELPD